MINSKNPRFENGAKVVDDQKENFLASVLLENTTNFTEQPQISELSTIYVEGYQHMTKAIRTSGVWLMGWAIFSVIQQNISWGIAVAIVGLMSFYFSNVASMFLVYAGVMLWAAIWNILLSGDPMWMVIGIVQIVFIVLSIRDYRKYRNTKALYASIIDHQDTSSLPHRESRMAWLALCLGSFILVGLVGFIPAGIAMYYINTTAFDELVGTILMVIIEIGMLGMPVGIAALISGYQPKAAAAIGAGLGILSGLLLIGMVILGSIG